MSPPEVSRFWFSESTAWIRSDPGAWLRLLWLKFRGYWGAYEIPDNLDFYAYREKTPVLSLPLPGFGVVAPFGLLGAVLAFRKGGWPRLLMLFVVVYSLSVVVFFVFSRFRMAMMPAIFVLAGYGIIQMWNTGRSAMADRKKRGALLWRSLLLVAIFMFVNLPVRAPAGSAAVKVAETLGLPVKVADTAIAHLNLGLSLAKQAKEADDPDTLLQMAERELREAVRQEKRYAKPYVELGKLLANMNRNREAIEMYNEAERLEPGQWRTYHSLGLLYRRLNDLRNAEESFREAAQLNRRSPVSLIQLGQVLMAQERKAEAAEAFRRALAISPDSDQAKRGLAEALQ
jgi:cytochrome c-type biogenesis protein CcmH/NrfG